MQPPKLPSFFKIPQHDRFEYKPRFYNPDKETFSQKPESDENLTEKDKLRKQSKTFQRQTFGRIRGTMQSRRHEKKFVSRVAIIFILLVLAVYLLLRL